MPEVTSHTCRSSTALTPSTALHRLRRSPPGRVRVARPPGTRGPESRTSPKPALNISAGHDQRGDRIDPVPAGPPDDGAGHRGSDEGIQVGEDVLETAFHVEALPVGLAHHPHGDQVHPDAGHGHHGDQRAVDLRRRDQPHDRLDDEPGREQQQGQPVELRTEDFRSLEAEGVAAAGRVAAPGPSPTAPVRSPPRRSAGGRHRRSAPASAAISPTTTSTAMKAEQQASAMPR